MYIIDIYIYVIFIPLNFHYLKLEQDKLNFTIFNRLFKRIIFQLLSTVISIEIYKATHNDVYYKSDLFETNTRLNIKISMHFFKKENL